MNAIWIEIKIKQGMFGDEVILLVSGGDLLQKSHT